MFLPRRRITSLTLASLIALAVWYTYYSPDASQSAFHHIANKAAKAKPGRPDLGSEIVSSNTTTTTVTIPSNLDAPTENLQPPKVAPPARFSSGQKTFGQYTFQEKNPVKEYLRFSSGLPLELPKVQYEFGTEAEEDKTKRLTRLAAVRSSFEHSWQGYKEHAWMKDELTPMDGGSAQSFGGWAATLVDTLDTVRPCGYSNSL